MKQVLYSPNVFIEFIALVGRYFYDDASIAILDFLAIEQRAFVESELVSILNWKESFAMQILHRLESQMLIERAIESERGSKTMSMWRISNYAFKAVEWRYKSLVSSLQLGLKTAESNDFLICPACNIKVDLLDAASGPTALDDDHPLCRQCSTRLNTCASEETRIKYEDFYNKVVKQLSLINTLLERVKGMTIPKFTTEKYTIVVDEAEENKSTTNYEYSESNVSDKVEKIDIPWFEESNEPTTNKSKSLLNETKQYNSIDINQTNNKYFFIGTNTFGTATNINQVSNDNKRNKTMQTKVPSYNKITNNGNSTNMSNNTNNFSSILVKDSVVEVPLKITKFKVTKVPDKRIFNATIANNTEKRVRLN